MEPKLYTATTVERDPDPFTGRKTREVTGYYVKHLKATPYPISSKEEYDQFVDYHTRHYIFCDGFSDWGLPRELEKWEIDPKTLKEVKQNEQLRQDNETSE